MRGAKFLRHYWRKIVIALFAMILLASPILFMLYFGFWLGRWTIGLKLIRSVKDEKKSIVEVTEKAVVA